MWPDVAWRLPMLAPNLAPVKLVSNANNWWIEQAAADLQLTLARHHAAASPDTLGFMYTDGHTRAYFGKRDIQKMHVTRLKFPGPATVETWVTGSAGDPLLVVMAQPSSSLAAQIRDLLPALRDIAGPAAKPVLCFDRGGWSPALFADITDAGFDLLAYRKNDTGKDIPDLPEAAISEGEHKGRVLTLRQVTRRKPGDTRQVHILTTRPAGDLPAAGVIYRMTSRAGGKLLPLRPRPLRPRHPGHLRHQPLKTPPGWFPTQRRKPPPPP
jgi:hypothetical protein